jgi:transcriptional regulator with XRE-family HTH domain
MAKPENEALSEAESVSRDVRLLFGQNCRAARVKAGLSQEEISIRTGIPQPRVSRIEQGKQNLTIDTMIILAKALGRDLAYLLQKPRNRIE